MWGTLLYRDIWNCETLNKIYYTIILSYVTRFIGYIILRFANEPTKDQWHICDMITGIMSRMSLDTVFEILENKSSNSYV